MNRDTAPIRLALAAIALLAAASACSLSGSQVIKSPTLTPVTPLITPSPLPITPTFIIVTPTLTPTGVALPQPNTGPVILATRANCIPQTTWPLYTVVAGDTLGVIAAASNTTVDQLVAANCLANADVIYVGQQLHVPLLPAAPTPMPTLNTSSGLPIFGQTLVANPYWLDPTNRAVTYSDVVRVDAGEVLNASRVVFYVSDPAGGPAIQIGTDEDPWDGAFVDYAFPAIGIYTFQAVALGDTAQAASTTFSLRYDPAFVPATGQRNLLAITPAVLNAGWYTVTGNSVVTVSWPDAPIGALRVDFIVTPTGTNTAGAAQTIGSDLNPADGSAAAWTVQPGISAHVQAVATMPDGSTQLSELANVISTG